MPFSYKHPRPALTTDCVIFGFDGKDLKVLLIERDGKPFAGQWAFPGGFVEMDEELADSAARELAEETGLRDVSLEQFHTFDAVDRDPRERVISVAHYALVNLGDYRAEAADDARNIGWYAFDDVPPLAFDHAEILKVAREHLQSRVRHQPIGLDLLPPEFPLCQLRQLYESVLGRRLETQSFRNTLFSTGILREADPTGPKGTSSGERLYAFDRATFEEMARGGFYLDI